MIWWIIGLWVLAGLMCAAMLYVLYDEAKLKGPAALANTHKMEFV